MGLRLRLRKTFSSSHKKPTAETHTPSPGETYYTDRTDIEYYKPHEIPRSKYRGKIDPEHQASLAAFSLADAFASVKRRSSLALSGTFSPGGTKAQSRATSRAPSRVQSRAPSRVHSRAPSRVQSRIQSRAPSRRPSHSGLRTETHMESLSSSGSTSREKSLTASTALDVETASTSISDQPTAVSSAPAEQNLKYNVAASGLTQHDSGIAMDIPEIVLSKQTTAHDTPFTAEELEQAMTRATLKSRDFRNRDEPMMQMGRRSAIASS